MTSPKSIFSIFSLLVQLFAASLAIADLQQTASDQPESAAQSSTVSAPVEVDSKAGIQAEPQTDSAAADEGAINQPLVANVVFRERTAFKLLKSIQGLDASAIAEEKRKLTESAEKVSQLLEAALTTEEPKGDSGKLVDIVFEGSKKATIFVRGYKVAELTELMAKEAGAKSLEVYLEPLTLELTHFVEAELERLKFQQGALKFFLSVFFAFIGFIALKQIHVVFDRAESILEQKRGSFPPIVLLSETLISGQTLGGLLAFTIAVGRLLSYIVLILSTLAAVFGQFAVTREIIGSFLAQIFGQTVQGLQTLLESIPGILLAVALLFALQLALKMLDLFLKGVKSGRIHVSFLNIDRIPVLKFWGNVVILMVLAPLVVASIFGKFHTPLEIILLLVAFSIALAALPLLATAAVGSFIAWQGFLKQGQWVKIGQIEGEIANMSLHKITVVPASGGRIYVPMLGLIARPLVDFGRPPVLKLRVRLNKTKDLESLHSTLNAVLSELKDFQIKCHTLGASTVVFDISVPLFGSHRKETLLGLLAAAHEAGKISLTSDEITEV